ncbi:MAG: molybdopterin-synthase adenylyltransferase MoeB, partial [Pleurocapsa sp.]
MLNPNLEAIELNKDEYQRYSRHIILPEVGLEGQKRLKAASVLCIGSGGLGSPLLLYLAAAGIGRIGVVDFDIVDSSNLQRQIIHSESWVGKPKIESAKDRIHSINPHCQVDLYETAISSENALDFLAHYDVVVDGADNFPTRYLTNDACVLLDKPNVYGSIFRFEGQATVFNYQGGPNYRDLYPEPPPPGMVPSCAEGGVLGVLCGIIGTIQATEAIKIILGAENTLSGRLLLYNAWDMKFRELKLRPNPERPVIEKLIDYQEFCGIPQAAAAEAEAGNMIAEMSVQDLKQLMDSGKDDFVLLDVRNPNEYEIAKIDGSVLIPLSELEDGSGVGKVKELLNGHRLIAHCKLG